MRAVFEQAAYVKRQPSWLARLIQRVFDWIAEQLSHMTAMRRASPTAFWTVIIVAAAIAAAIIARLAWVSYVRRKRGIAARPAPAGSSAVGFGRDPWSAAQQFAASGDFTAAAHALYAALLATIARRGLVRLHPSKTAGDYARELRARSASGFSLFRDFARAYDVVVYGTGVCDRERWERLRQLALPIVQGDG